MTKVLFRPLMLLIAAIGLMAGSIGLHAQTQRCGGYADVLADLRSAYGEQVRWIFDGAPGSQLVITATPDGSSWTMLFVEGAVACLVSAGNGWEALAAGEDI